MNDFQSADMERRREHAMAKVWNAINDHGGTTLLSTGITADDARLAKAVVDAGVRMLEPNHPAIALARGLHGVKDMHNAEAVRHELDLTEIDRVVQGVRAVAGPDVFVTVGIPGGFTELQPVDLGERHFYDLARAGADGLHTHKSCFQDLDAWVAMAHSHGLTVDAYIAHPDDRHPFGIPAGTPEEVAAVARRMEDQGVDMIGLMTGMSYGGTEAGDIPGEIKERLAALTEAVSVPTLAEGGINADNYHAFRGTGVHVIVVGTSFDDVARRAVAETASKYIGTAVPVPSS
ncbi:histidine biosynthesis protein [Ruania alba]|nr:histidine biosynthesis protein [Ruania alba]